MREQINTIREALKIEEFICSHGSDVPVHITEALTALAQIEAAVGEPVAYIHRQGKHWEVAERPLLDDEKARGWIEEPLYTAAPVAQQPRTALEQYDLDQSPEYRKGWDDGRIKGYEVGHRHATEHAAAKAQQPQAEAVPPTHVLVPVAVLKAASESLGSFVSDQGWTTLDMQAMDNLDAIIAQQKGQP